MAAQVPGQCLDGLQALSVAAYAARTRALSGSNPGSLISLVCYRPLGSVAASTIGPHDRSDCILDVQMARIRPQTLLAIGCALVAEAGGTPGKLEAASTSASARKRCRRAAPPSQLSP